VPDKSVRVTHPKMMISVAAMMPPQHGQVPSKKGRAKGSAPCVLLREFGLPGKGAGVLQTPHSSLSTIERDICNLSYVWARDVHGGKAQICMVQYVRRVRSQYELDSLCDAELLHKGSIQIHKLWPIESVERISAESVRSG
jgi:hypothetical protein